ncbi:MAG: anthranilate synthase component I [Clostridia bacterium]|jgi:anthranilate synthase component 1|nr:anthranilate synthase component I [Clostridia bacterium]
MYPSSGEEFIKLAQKGDLIPVYAEYSAALETPLSVFLKTRRGSYGFLLESVEKGQSLGRYSIISSEPQLIFSVQEGKVKITEKGQTVEQVVQDPLEELENVFKRYQAVKVPGLSGFTGGAIGYCGYEMVRYFAKLQSKKKGEPDFPECMFMFPETFFVFDHVRQVLQIVVNVKVTENSRQDYAEAVKKIELLRARLDAAIPACPKACQGKGGQQKFNYQANLTSNQYQEMVREAKKYIEKGEVSQVVLAQQFMVPLPTEPLAVYRVLRSLNPSPYLFYLQLDDLFFVGSSPELLVKVENRRVEIRPIAGTRPRAADEVRERELEEELLNDRKEKAEHLMLVDSGCAELERISACGTVKVENLMEVEKYSHVMHLVSQVTGTLAPSCNCFDVLKACFPAGTVSGTPKIRAMELIDALESTPRGPYGGAVGYINYGGEMNTCLTIRTLIVKNGLGYIQAGAGIVADSDPLKEYQETLNKAQALFKAVEMAAQGS